MLMAAKLRRRTFRIGDAIISEGSLNNKLFIIRDGEAAVEVAGSKSRVVVATLGPDDICGEMSFLERNQASAAVIAKSDELQADEIEWQDMQDLFHAFPRLASRFYQSLAVMLSRRLRDTSRELAREMMTADTCRQNPK